jgi:hypothetical protein
MICIVLGLALRDSNRKTVVWPDENESGAIGYARG